jgi:hypothetical protein
MKKSWATAMILSILEPWDTFPAKYAIKQYTLSAFQIEYIWRINIGIRTLAKSVTIVNYYLSRFHYA